MTLAMITAGSTADAETIANLTTRLNAATLHRDDLIVRLAQSKDAHRADIELIGAKLIDEANNRQWCHEYDGIVDELNDDLNISLPVRERDYVVTVSVTVEVQVSATDEDDAKDKAREIFERAESAVDRVDGVGTSQWGTSWDYDVSDD